MEVRDLLSEVIYSELEEIRRMDVGSEEYKVAVDGVTKLADRAIELKKVDIELMDKAETRKQENSFRQKQMDEERVDRLIRNCISVAGIILPLGVTIWGTLASFKFEEEGTVTTMMGRGFINKLLPKK